MNREQIIKEWAREADRRARKVERRLKRKARWSFVMATVSLAATAVLLGGSVWKYAIGEYQAATVLMLFVIAGVLFDIERKPHA